MQFGYISKKLVVNFIHFKYKINSSSSSDVLLLKLRGLELGGKVCNSVVESWTSGKKGKLFSNYAVFCERAKILGRTSYHKENNCKVSNVTEKKVDQKLSYITAFGDM